MRIRLLILVALSTVLISPLSAQHVEINAANKTISVSADAEVTADAEVAELSVGYQNFGTNKDTVYKENVSTANNVTNALIDVGLKPEQIETAELSIQRVDAEQSQSWSAEEKKERQFRARQTWRVRVLRSQAQTVLDIALKAGANESSEPKWDVANRNALQAKAGAAALRKASDIADHMAEGLGVKIKALIYASNRAPSLADFLQQSWLGESSQMITVSATPAERVQPVLKLFPQKVKQEATVFAVFSIE